MDDDVTVPRWRLQAILERFDREDTGVGHVRPEIAWAMASDLRDLLRDLTEQRQVLDSQA